MIPLRNRLQTSPALVRVLPFAIFAGLTALQGQFGEAGRFWIYLFKTLAGAGAIWLVWPFVAEMRWKLSWEAVSVGVGVFVFWVGLAGFYPKLGKAGAAWNPNVAFGEGSALAWCFIAIRLLGSTFVVPLIEEVFYRSFLYRAFAERDFLNVPSGRFFPVPFLLTSVIFGITHQQWLAGILCGAAYQWLVLRKGRLGDAITAHTVTNLLLGLWVVWKGAWQFW